MNVAIYQGQRQQNTAEADKPKSGIRTRENANVFKKQDTGRPADISHFFPGT